MPLSFVLKIYREIDSALKISIQYIHVIVFLYDGDICAYQKRQKCVAIVHHGKELEKK